ncbi:Hypothetical_protein [Hexamita inflata]|uniref:Hypothetical_protein n=1 Tax=Hexamita inflata TaxID=28002 RepID=A0AA86N829_9EUKA|nr:Hypothetical protein HINF_LOCUS2081 [Hexamita inflata]
MIKKQLLDIFYFNINRRQQDNILDSVSTLRQQYFKILINPESSQLQQNSDICGSLSSRNISSLLDLKVLNSVTNSDDQEIASRYIYFNTTEDNRTIYLIRFQH